VRTLFLSTCVSVCAVLALGAQSTQQQRPVFRGGVDIVQLDVLVLDKDRHPIPGLTAADFTVTENGKPQTVVAVSEVDVPPPVAPAAPWMRDVAPDVTSNDLDARRLVVIVMDDAGTGADQGEPTTVRKTARDILDHLGPNDLAAVVYTFLGRPQNFTSNRAQLLAAIDAFQPKNVGAAGPPLACKFRDGGCTVQAMTMVSEVLRTAPPGRKTIIFLGPGPIADFSRNNDSPADLFGGISKMFQSLQESNTTVYTIDPRGLTVGRQMLPDLNSEIALAEATGGRRIQMTNEPWRKIKEIFAENETYYLIGYRSTFGNADGQFHRTQVKVNRPGAEVRARLGYFAPRPERAKKARASVAAEDEAISRGLPTGDLPLSVTTAAFATPAKPGATVAVVVAANEFVGNDPNLRAGKPSPRRISLIATAYDQENWKAHGAERQTIQLTLNPTQLESVQYEVISRLPLAPGRYEVRFGAESGGKTGSVYMTMDVPNFAKDELSASGLILSRTPARPIAPRNGLSDLAPIVPTTVRDFEKTDVVAGFLRLYQGGTRPLAPVSVSMRVVNDTNTTVVERSQPMPVEQFTRGRAADYRFDLPLTRLTAGEYLLTIAVTMPKHSVERTARFTVR